MSINNQLIIRQDKFCMTEIVAIFMIYVIVCILVGKLSQKAPNKESPPNWIEEEESIWEPDYLGEQYQYPIYLHSFVYDEKEGCEYHIVKEHPSGELIKKTKV